MGRQFIERLDHSRNRQLRQARRMTQHDHVLTWGPPDFFGGRSPQDDPRQPQSRSQM